MTETYVDPIVSRIMGDIGDLEDSGPWMRNMLYGDTGTAKTTYASGAPRNLFIEADVGNLNALRSPWATRFQQQYKVMRYTSIERIEELSVKAKEGAFAGIFDTFTLDKLTDMSFTNLADITVRQHGQGHLQAVNLRNLFKPETDDYTENNERLRRIVDNFRRAPAHLIVICHYRYFKSASGVMKTSPDFSEKLVGNLSSMFNLVGYTYREEDGSGGAQMMMRTQPNPMFVAKCNIDNVPPIIANPTWPDVYAAYMRMREAQV